MHDWTSLSNWFSNETTVKYHSLVTLLTVTDEMADWNTVIIIRSSICIRVCKYYLALDPCGWEMFYLHVFLPVSLLPLFTLQVSLANCFLYELMSLNLREPITCRNILHKRSNQATKGVLQNLASTVVVVICAVWPWFPVHFSLALKAAYAANAT